MLATADLDFSLPEELIATHPAEPRDAARLLVVRRSRPGEVEDLIFRELDGVIGLGEGSLRESARATDPQASSRDAPRQPTGDVLVLNATRVLPARFRGVRTDTNGHAEGLYLGPAATSPDGLAGWRCLFKMRRAKPGVRVALLSHDGERSGVDLVLVERLSEEGDWRALACDTGGDAPLRESPREILSRVGLTPIPPYILAARKAREQIVEDARDASDYQTVYAADSPNPVEVRGEGAATSSAPLGSVAAPTAGLHFTPDLLDRLRSRGVTTASVYLDVGMGTFKPVETEFVEHHAMHAEFCCVPPETIRAAMTAQERNSRVIAVGTTAARTLESFDDRRDLERRGPMGHFTRLLITPGWRWRFVDGLITNFHLPRTTLLAMVAAMLHTEGDDPRASVERLRTIYAHAVREKYRFYSYGDAMVILP